MHKTIMFGFIGSFLFFSIAQSMFPYLFNLGRPTTVLAGSNTKTWTTRGDFINNNGATGNITTSITNSITGGTITTDGLYTVHKFTSSDNLVVPTGANTAASVLVVGGGGGGGGSEPMANTGGGGAGGLLTGSQTLSGTMGVTVGSGGGSSSNGLNSSFGSTTAIGGGYGGSLYGGGGGSGGSGGGSASWGYGGNGTAGQGYGGGSTAGISNYSAGGGGAGQVGNEGDDGSYYGTGGNGIQNSISGTATYYAGGGAGATAYRSAGGAGGGGDAGGGNGVAGNAGAANTGGGGGGGVGTGLAGAGGSGIVIVRYLTPTLIVSGSSSPDDSSITLGAGATAGTLGGTSAGNVGLRIDTGAGLKTKASSLTWNGTTASAGQKILFKVRAGDTQAELDANACYGPTTLDTGCADWTTAGKLFSQINGSSNSGTGIPAAIASKRYMEVLVRLESSGANTPTLNDVTLSYDTLESPTNANIILTKTNTTALKNSSGTTITGGVPNAWINDTSIRITANSLTCTSCGTAPTNLRPEVEVKAVGSAFTGTGTVIATPGNTYADITGLSAGTSYHLQVRAIDDQGRASAWTSYGGNAESEADFSIEQTAPIGTFTISSNAQYTNSTSVTLALSVTDAGSSSLSQMRFSSDGSTWSDWETYASSKNWTLSNGDGIKTVYAQVRDNADNTTSLTCTNIAPKSPVADWQAMTQGNHYGDFYDFVSGNWATVTRAGGKTIYDPTNKKIYDVPANKLGVNPRSDGKGGSEAVVEGSRTNYLLNSYFNADANSDGLSDSWADYGERVGTPTYTRGTSPVYGTYQRTQYTGAAGDSGQGIRIMQTSAAGPFASGQSATASAYLSGSSSGVLVRLYAEARNSSNSTLGSVYSSDITLTAVPTKYTVTYASLPANTFKVSFDAYVMSIDTGDTVDMSVAVAQLEKGVFATSYIPTTTATVTRNADDVTVPTTSWSASAGTMSAVYGTPSMGGSSWPDNASNSAGWMNDNSNYIVLNQSFGYPSVFGYVLSGGNMYSSYSYGTLPSYLTHSLTWAVGQPVYTYLNDIQGPSDGGNLPAAPTGLPSTAMIGSLPGNGYANGPIQRLTVYSSALSSSDVSAVTNAVKDGAGSITLDTTSPNMGAVSAKTDSGGSTIPTSTWQPDNDPYISWSAPSDTSGIAGYYYAVDNATPESGGAYTTDVFAQLTADSVADGAHTIYVRAKDNAGNQAGTLGSFIIWVDTSAPTITDTQTGDNTWRKTNAGTYNVDYADTGSGLQKYEIQIRTATGGGGSVIKVAAADWTSVAINGAPATYTTNWSVPSAVWSALAQGTNYIYVRATDMGNLASASTEVFYIKKDTSTLAPTTVSDGTGTDIASTSSKAQLSANWATVTDSLSGLLKYQYAIGTSAGGTNTVTWTDNATTTSVTKTGLTLSDGVTYFFTVRAVDNAGNTGSVTNSNGQVVDSLAPTGSMTINSGNPTYTNTKAVTLLLDPTTPEPGGSGMKEFQLSNDGTTWGTTTDTSGVVSDSGTWKAWNEGYRTGGAGYVSLWWLNGADGSKTVYIKYKDNAGNIAGGTTDPNYVSIGTQVWAKNNLNVGTMVTGGTTQSVGQKWCYNNLESNCTTYGGLYQWGLATTSGGAGQTDVCPTGFHLPTDAEFTTLETNVGTTPGDKLKKAGLCQGRTPCGTSGFDALLAGYYSGGFLDLGSTDRYWSSAQVDTTNAWARNLYLSNSTVDRNDSIKTRGFSVRCLKNDSTVPTIWTISPDSITLDTTVPTTIATANDGTGADASYTTSTTQLSANWTTSTDSGSGLSKYQYAIGATAGAIDVVTWTDNSTTTSVTKTGLSLTNGQTYYFTVRGVDNAGNNSTATNSNGILIDTTNPPAPASVSDGTGADVANTTSKTQLSANWASVIDTDPDGAGALLASGLLKYQYAIGTSAGGTDTLTWTDNATTTSVTKTGLTLSDGVTYFFTVRAVDNAGNTGSVTNSNGQVVDSLAPTGTMTINTGNPTYTNTKAVTLFLNPTTPEPGGSGMKEFQLSNDGTTWGTTTDTSGVVSDSGTWKAWNEGYRTGGAGYVSLWWLNGADGSKTVYIKYKDNAGNINTAVADSYPSSNWDNSYSLDSAAFTAAGQSFTAAAGTLGSAKFVLNRGGSPTGNIYAKLYAHSGTFGTSSIPTGSALATSSPIDASTLFIYTTLANFAFDNSVTLVGGTHYFIIVEYAGGDGSNYVNLAIDTSSPTHAGNAANKWQNGGWSAQSGHDVIFDVNEIVGTAISDSITLDTTAPTFNSITPATNAYRKDGNVTFTLSESLQSGAYLRLTSTTAVGGETISGQHTYSLTGAELTTLTSQTKAVTGLVDGNVYTLSLYGQDLAGNIDTIADNTNITYDATPATFIIAYYTDSSLNTSLTNTYMKAGTYYIKLTPSEALGGTPTVNIAAEGTANDVTSGATTSMGGGIYRYTRTVVYDAVATGVTAEDITITGTDLAGNVSTNATVTGEEYTDTVLPTLPTATIASNNGNTNQAKIGDRVTLTIGSSENIWTPTVTIAGHSATVSGSNQNWSAYYNMVTGDTEGTIAFNIAFSDIATNNGTAVTTTTNSSSVTFDKTAPTAPATPAFASADDDGAYNNDAVTSKTTGLTFSGTAEANATVVIFDGATSKGTTTATGGNWSIDIFLSEDSHSITVKATDAAGNPSSSSSARTVVVDSTTPTAITLTSPTDFSWVGSVRPTLTWSQTTETNFWKYEVFVDGVSKANVANIATTSWQFNYDLTEGTHTWYVEANDLAGHDYSSMGSLFTVKIDVTSPSAPTGVTASPSGYTSNNTWDFSWTSPGVGGGSPLAGYYFRALSAPTTNTDGTWTTGTSTTQIVPGLSQGANTFYVFAKDTANPANVNYQNVGTTTFYFDNIKPVSAVSIPNAIYGPNTFSATTISGTASDATSGLASTEITIQRNSDSSYYTGTAWGAQTWLNVGAASTWSYNLPQNKMDNGVTYTITSKSTDNSSPAMVQTSLGSDSFTWDNQAPTSSVGAFSRTYYSSTNKPGSVTGTATDTGTSNTAFVKLRIWDTNATPGSDYWTGSAWGAQTNLSAVNTGTNYSTWSYGISGVTYITGHVYHFGTYSQDGVTNEETFAEDRSFTYDDTAATGTIAFTSGWSTSTSVSIAKTFTDSESGTVAYELQEDTGTLANGTPGWNNSYTTVDSTSGATYTRTGVTGTAYRYRYRVQNGAGTWSGYNTNTGGEIKIDTTAPTVNTFSYADGWNTSGSYTVVKTESDAQSGTGTYELQEATASITNGAVGSFGTFTTVSTVTGNYLKSGATSGTAYKYRYRVQNAAGTWSGYSTSSNVVKVDTVAPGTISTLAALSTNSTTTIKVIWQTPLETHSGITSYTVERTAKLDPYVASTNPTTYTYSAFTKNIDPANLPADVTYSSGTYTFTDTTSGMTDQSWYGYRIKAIDAAGNDSGYLYGGTPGAVDNYVAGKTNTPPTIANLSVTPNANVSPGASISIAFDATDPDEILGHNDLDSFFNPTGGYTKVKVINGSAAVVLDWTEGTRTAITNGYHVTYSYPLPANAPYGTYTVAMKALDSVGVEERQYGTSTATFVTPPADIASLTATGVVNSAIALTFAPPADRIPAGSGVAEYVIERKLSGENDSTFAEIKKITSGDVSYYDSGTNSYTYEDGPLAVLTYYTYRIKAKDVSGNYSLNWTVSGSAATPDRTPPNPITDLTLSSLGANGTTATISWTVPADNSDSLTEPTVQATKGTQKFKVFRRTTDASFVTGDLIVTLDKGPEWGPGYLTGDASYADSGLTEGTTYYYLITALDNGLPEGDGFDPNETTMTPTHGGNYQDITTLMVPVGMTIRSASDTLTAGNARLVVSWTPLAAGYATAPAPYNFANYVVERKIGAGSWSELTTISDIATNYLVDDHLDPDITYVYRVKVKNGNNNVSSASTEVSMRPDTIDTEKPTITFDKNSPSDLTTTASTIVIHFTTSESTVPIVEYDTTANYISNSSLGQSKGSGTYGATHTITINSLAPDTSYRFKVRAIDAAGNAGELLDSGNVPFTTATLTDNVPPANPNVPSGYSDSGKGTPINSGNWYNYANPYFEWSGAIDSDSQVAGYYVYFGTNASANPAVSGGYQAVATYTASGSLSSGSIYYLLVKAKDSSGNTSAVTSTLFQYKYDTDGPTSTISVPTNGSFYQTTPSVSGSAADVSSNIDRVLIKVRKVENSTNYYLSGGSWVTEANSWNLATGYGDWNFTLSSLTSGQIYYLSSKAYDVAVNEGSASSEISFTFDNTIPTISRAIIVSTSANQSSKLKQGDTFRVYTNVTDNVGVAAATTNLAVSGNVLSIGKTALVLGSISETTINGQVYNYRSELQTADGTITEGAKTFHINAADTTGNNATQFTAGSVTIDNTFSGFSNIASSASSAKEAASVNITFTASETLAANPTVTVNGHLATYSSINGLNYIYSYTIQSTDNDSNALISITGTDTAGNTATNTNTSALLVDKTSPVVTVTAPNGGEKFKDGTSTNIAWAAADVTSGLATTPITISYTVNGTNWTQIAANETNDGTYTWTVPSLNTATVKVKVVAVDNAGNTQSVSSAANFLIDSTAPAAFGVIGATNVNTATPTFSWNASSDGGAGLAKYELFIDGAKNTDDPADIPSSSTSKRITTSLSEGSHTWYVRASDAVSNTINSTSGNVNVSIDLTKPSSTLTDPTTHEYIGTSSYTITGTSSGGTGSNINKVEVSVNGGSSWADATNTGTNYSTWSYTWTTPTDGEYIIQTRATDTAGNREDPSTGIAVTIDKTAPVTGTISAPATGQSLRGSGNTNITWSGISDAIGLADSPLTLTYSDDGGTDGYPHAIASQIANSGSFTWTVPAINSNNVKVRVKAEDKVTHTATNFSYTLSGAFTIDSTAPSVSLTSLTGGQTLKGGAATSVTWTSSDNYALAATPITISYSTNATDWTQIATNEANDGTYSWTVPSINSQTVKVKVTSADAVGNTQTSASASNLTIDSTNPTVSLTSLSGGQVLKGGAATGVTWTSSDNYALAATPITISYSVNGVDWTQITTNETNDGTYPWTVPSINSQTVKVKVTSADAAGNLNTARSIDNFTVDSTNPTVSLTSLNGGQTLKGGSATSVTWTSGDNYALAATPITISYSVNGVDWTQIATNELNDGTYTWTVPSLNTATVKLKVSSIDVAGNTNTAQSASNFSIDSTSPTDGSVAITSTVGETYAPKTGVSLALSATDPTVGGVSSGVSQMIIANVSDFSGANWEDYGTSKSWNLTDGNGQKTVYIKFKDAVGNESASYSDSITLDVTRTDIPVISSSTHANESQTYSNASPAFTWTTPTSESGIAGYSYILNQNASTVPDDTIDTTGNSASYSGKTDGVWYFHLKVKNNSGLFSDTASYTTRIDTTTPTSTITSPVNSSKFSSIGEITGTAFDVNLEKVEIALKNTNDTKWYNGSDWNSGTEQWVGASGTGNWTYSLPSLTSGKTYEVKSKATDLAQNAETPSVTVSFLFDNTAPTISRAILSSANSSTQNKIYTQDNYYVYAQADDSIGISTVTMNASTLGNDTSLVLVSTDGPWTVNAQTYNFRSALIKSGAEITEGSKSISVNATDTAGNNSNVLSFNVIVDNTTANFTSFSSSRPLGKTGDQTTIQFTASEVLKVNPGVTINGHLATFSSINVLVYQYSYTIQSNDPDGATTATVVGADMAGNSNTVSSGTLFTVDNTAPARPTVVAATTPTNLDTQTITGTSEANSLVKITGGTQDAEQQLFGGATSYSITVTLNQNTENTLIITATDAAGNIGLSATTQILHDNTAPDTQKITLVAPNGSNLNTTTPTFVWSTDNGADTGSGLDYYEVWIDNAKNSDGPANIPAVSSPSQKHITSALSEGSHSWYVKIFDKAGNSSSKEAASLSVSIDLTKPTSTITSPNTHLYLNGTTLSVTGTATKGSAAAVSAVDVSISKSGDGLNFVPVTSVFGAGDTKNWTYSWTIPSGNDGNYFIISRATDLAGNVENYGSGVTVTIDKSAPQISDNSESDITTSSANILWTTNEETTSVLEYGITTAYGTTVSVADFYTNHQIRIDNLTDNLHYHYIVKSTDRSGNETISSDRTFTTVSLDHTLPVISAVAQSVTASTATITWVTDEVATSQVEYADNIGFTASESTTLSADNFSKDHRVTIEGLAHNTTYYFKVKSKDSFLNETILSASSFTTTRIPGINAGSVANEVDQNANAVKIAWISDIQTTSYVEYGITGIDFNDIVGEEEYKTSHTILLYDLLSLSEYQYRVKGKNDQGNEIVSATGTFTAPAFFDKIPPVIAYVNQPISENIGISVGVSTATIQWSTNKDSDSTVEYKKVGDSEYRAGVTDPLVAVHTAHQITLKKLDPDTNYTYRLKSRDTTGNLGTSTEYTFKTGKMSISDVSIIKTVSSATLTWKTNISADSQVEYQRYGVSEASKIEGSGEMVTEHSIKISNLTPGPYSYKLKSKDADGNTVETPLDTFEIPTTDSSNTLSSPQAGKIEEQDITATSAKITWTSTNATFSWIDYGTASNTYTKSAGNDTMTVDHIVTLDGLVPGSTYYYIVRGKDGTGTEYRSKEYSFVALAKPGISSMKVSDITNYSAKVTIEATKEVQASVSYGKDGKFDLKAGGSVMAREHEIKLENLDDNATYTYVVDVSDSAGNTARSQNETFNTPIDKTGPEVKEVKIEVLPLGDSDETGQAIISWTTSKPATTKIEYGEGIIGGKYEKSSIEDRTLNTSHTVIIKELNSSATYHFRIVSKDKRDNETKSNDFTFVTPTKEKSILQLILKSLEETFSWVRNIGSFFSNLGKKIK